MPTAVAEISEQETQSGVVGVLVIEQKSPAGTIDTKTMQELLTEIAAEAAYRDW